MTVIDEVNCVVRKGQFKIGDLAVYIPLEAMVPMDKPQFQGLGIKTEKSLYRVKAIRLRGTYSEGLLVPYAYFGATAFADQESIGKDMSAEWGIVKYEEPEIPTAIQGTVKSQQDKDITWAPKYNVENLLKNRNAISEGVEVVVTEKIHGCVPPNAMIVMSDGSCRRMIDVREGDFVLGKTPEGSTVASRVLEKFDNGKTDIWLHFRTTNNEAGRGTAWRTFTCTPNHEVFVNGAFTAAENVKVGDRVLVNRRDMDLNPIQREVLTGKLLGDGSMFSEGRSIVWGHSEAQREYSNWTAECIGMLAHPTEAFATSGYGSEMSRRRTVNSDLVKSLTAEFSTQEGKQVPADIALTPISLAFWYMDDGSLSHDDGQIDRACFAVCSFNQQSVINLVTAMAKLGLKAVIQGEPGRFRLRLNATDAELFFLMVAPYIHPSMQYKLPARYRGAPAWFPKVEFKPTLIPQTVTKIQKKTGIRKRLDMSTETSNYFVGGVLVHNCNGRFVYGKDVHGVSRLMVGSHNVWKRPVYTESKLKMAAKRAVNALTSVFGKQAFPDPIPVNDDVWWTIAKHLDLASKLKAFPKLVVYGEVYGSVQDLKYSVPGNEKVRFRVFDMYDANSEEWLCFETVTAMCSVFGLEMVPVLYRGPYVRETVDPLRTGKSTLDGVTIREGFVIRPEIPHDSSDKQAYKLVSEEYKLRKGDVTEFH
jgi:hypothetical protein